MKKANQDEHTGSSAYASVNALARDLGMCERSVRDALRRGDIPHIKIGKRYILPRSAIAEWLKNAAGHLKVIA